MSELTPTRVADPVTSLGVPEETKGERFARAFPRTSFRISVALLAIGLLLTLIGIAATRPDQWLNAGLLLLVVTPVLRVLSVLVRAAFRRDWFLLTCTLIVMGVLATTLTLAW